MAKILGRYFGTTKRKDIIFVVVGCVLLGIVVGFIYAATYETTAYSPRGGSYWSSTKTANHVCGPYKDDGRTTYTWKTASGACPQEGVSIATSSAHAFGTKLCLSGIGTRIVHDRGSAIQGNRIDLFMEDQSRALQWGRRNVSVTVGECGSGGGSPPPGGGSSGGCSTAGADTSGSHPTISRSNPVSSTCVKHVQFILTHLAKWHGDGKFDPRSCSSNASSCDGSYGQNTEKAVRAYRVYKRQSSSSTVDAKTWGALHKSCKYMQNNPKNGADCNGTINSSSSGGGGSSSSSCPTKGDSSGSHATVRSGMKSSCVAHLQYILTQTHKWRVKMYGSSNVDPGSCSGSGVCDGSYGPKTLRAVKNYQTGKGISPTSDGAVGGTTWAKLHQSCATINKYNFGGSKTYGIKC